MKIKEKIMEKAKKSKEIKIIFLNSTLGVEYVCYFCVREFEKVSQMKEEILFSGLLFHCFFSLLGKCLLLLEKSIHTPPFASVRMLFVYSLSAPGNWCGVFMLFRYNILLTV